MLMGFLTPEKGETMKPHVTAVAVLHIGLGILGVLGGSIIFFALNWVATFVIGEPDLEMLIPAIGTILGMGIAFFSVIDIVGGIGLLSFRSWARIVVLIMSVVNLVNFPVGTAVGIYSIVILVHSDTTALFEAGSPPMSPPAPS
jgi:hypothetical protein